MDRTGAKPAMTTEGANREDGAIHMHALAAIIVSTDLNRRRALIGALTSQGVKITREFSEHPLLDDLLKACAVECHIVVLDLEPDVETALGLVENISGDQALTVMVYAGGPDPELLMRSMRAGAREFLTHPLSAESLPEALVRASARVESFQIKKASGKLLLFLSAKGGAGVTTLASNFALALQQESTKEVALVDLNLRLGDVSVLLGLTHKYTVLDALRTGSRMDGDLISTLLAQHSSGLAVLAGPDDYNPLPYSENGSLQKLLRILRARFPFVVVDGGSGLGAEADTLLQLADVIYLVTQVDIPSLRNAQRVLAHMQKLGTELRTLEVVLNRFDSRGGIAQDQIEKALTVPAKWKIPNDYSAARSSHNAGSPLMLQKSHVSAALRQMAQTACGKDSQAKKRRMSLFG
jgi:pilus assembly protein CpaE